LYGREFWKKVINFQALSDFGLISPTDLDLFSFADTPEEAFVYFQEKIRLELTKKLGTKT
jgi:predicted Rossmann-fold nucleotide-binding protein